MVGSVSSTGTVSVNGLISGLDTSSIIEQLIALQSQRITRLQQQQTLETEKIALFQKLQGIYLGIRTSANALKATTLFESKLATSSDKAVLDATATKDAALGSHSITVKQLAAKNQYVSNRFGDTNVTTLGSGTLTITVGTGASAVKTDLVIDNTNNTLDGIKKLINDSGANVTADILKVDDSSNPFQLTITADTGGLANAVSITFDASIKNILTGEILGAGTTINTQDTDDTDAKTYALRHIPNAGTVTVKVNGSEVKEQFTGLSATSKDSTGTLSNSTAYSYVVVAKTGGTETHRSAIFNITTGASDDTIDFTFNDVHGADTYEIYRVADAADDIGAGGIDIDDFTGQNTLIGTVGDDGSSSFTFTDTNQAKTQVMASLSEGVYTLNETTGAVVFTSDQTQQVTADYEFDFEFLETQIAKDAEIVFGEGANALTIKKSTNTITDVIAGVTLDLKRVDTENPIIIDIKRTTFGLQGAVQNFLDSLNEVNKFVEEQAFFDETTFVKGPLFSDPNLFSIRTQVSNIVTGRVDSIPAGKFRALSEIGVKLSAQTGNYFLDSGEFGTAISDRLGEVRDLFSSVGAATDNDIKVLAFADATKTSDSLGYAVNITQAAARPEVVGAQDVSGGFTVDETLVITSEFGGNTTVNLTIGMTGQQAVAAINSSISSSGILNITATYNTGTGKITIRHANYGKERNFSVKSDQDSSTAGSSGLGGAAGITINYQGFDVAGTINGEAATGKGEILSGNSGNVKTDGLQISVLVTAANLVTQGSFQGYVTVSRGIASQLEEYLAFLTDETKEGAIQSAIAQADARVEDLQESIIRFTERAQRSRDKLLRDFTSLEQALGSLQTTSNFLSSQLKSIAAVSEAVIARSGR